MAHQYKAGDVVTVFRIASSNELVIEGKATIRKRVAEVDEHYRVEFPNKPGMTYERSCHHCRCPQPQTPLHSVCHVTHAL
jgi:hypothetical protein